MRGIGLASVEAISNAGFSPVSLLIPEDARPFLVVCEHASNHVPPVFGDLGISAHILKSHVAWDPGAGPVSADLSRLIKASYLSGEVSRLIYDCNRPPHASDAIPEKSEIYEIPGNRNLSPEDRDFRIRHVYEPFKTCLEDAVRRSAALISIHSFTPVFRGTQRDVELGIVHDSDSRLADLMMACAAQHTSLHVLRNAPYGPADGVTHTLKMHGIANGIPNVMIEIRNDLIATAQDCEAMASTLSGWVSQGLTQLLGQPETLEAGLR